MAAAGTVAILLVVLWPYLRALHERPPVAEAADLASGLRWPVSLPRRSLVAVVLLLLATGESFHGWGSDPWRDTSGRIHRFLATSPWPGAVLELPIYQRRYGFHRNARYLLASTVHWRPLVNGFGGFAPPDFDDHAHLASGFPSVLTVKWLQEIGVGYVVMDLDQYGNHLRRNLVELAGRRDLLLEAVEGSTRLYRIQPATSRASAAADPPASVRPAPGHKGVLLDLRASLQSRRPASGADPASRIVGGKDHYGPIMWSWSP